MNSVTSATTVATTARANDITLFASLELSKSKWVVTINSPGSEKFSKHVVDPASIAVARRHRRAKTDAIDGETLLRTLMAWARGERRVCSMVLAPSPEEEDRRRLTRERGTLVKERIQHTNRIWGLLSGQGVRDYNPLRRDRRQLPPMLKAEIRRELDRIAVVTTQLAAVERARDALVRTEAAEQPNTPAALLLKLRGIGPEFASLLWLESLFRSFGNRRQVAAYAGLAPSPWQSGGVERDQGSRSRAIAACARP